MKNKFRRGLLPLSALGAALVLVVSCGAQGAGYVPWNEEDSPKDISATITWWNNYSVPDLTNTTETQSRADGEYAEYWWATDVIAEFEELYPNIDVQMTYIGGYSDIQEAVDLGISGGNVPNIASCYGDHVAGYYNNGVTLAMDGFMDDEYIGFGKTIDSEGNIIDDEKTLKSDLNQNYFEAEKGMYASEEYLSLPYSKSAETLVVNLDVFNEKGYSIPTTWTDLIKTARQIKADYSDVFGETGLIKDSDGLVTAIPFVYDSAENMIISMLEMSGVDYTDGSGSGRQDRVKFNNDDAKSIVTQLKKWYDEGLICTQDQLYYRSGTSHQYSSNMMTYGTVFMCISSTTGARYFITDEYNFKFNATPTFTLASVGETGSEDTSQHKVISQGPSLTFFDKADVNENYASWLFYKYLTNSDNSATLAVNTSYFPIRTSSYESDEVKALSSAAESYNSDYSSYTGDTGEAYTGSVLALDEAYTQAGDYFVSDVFDESSSARTAIGNLIDDIFAFDTSSYTFGSDEYNAAVTAEVERQFDIAITAAIGA